MDAARTESPARDGPGLRPRPVVQGSATVVGPLGPRASGLCPYSLGATCPLVEIVAGRLMNRNEILRWSRISAVLLGLAVSISTVWMVHY